MSQALGHFFKKLVCGWGIFLAQYVWGQTHLWVLVLSFHHVGLTWLGGKHLYLQNHLVNPEAIGVKASVLSLLFLKILRMSSWTTSLCFMRNHRKKILVLGAYDVLGIASRSSVRVISVILTTEPLFLPLALILIIKPLKHGTISSFGKFPYIPLPCNIFYKIQKKLLGLWDVSVGNDTCCQAWWPEITLGIYRLGDPIPASCPMTSIYTLYCVYWINKCKKKY